MEITPMSKQNFLQTNKEELKRNGLENEFYFDYIKVLNFLKVFKRVLR